MNAEGFELAVATIILLRRVWKKRFKRKNRKQWVRAIFNERKEKIAKWENHTNIGIFLQLLLVSSFLKLHLFVFPMFMDFFQTMNVNLKISNIFNKSNYLLQQHYFNTFTLLSYFE